MSGFTRRFSDFPPVNVIREIEGIVIIDTPNPAVGGGVATGVVACIAEFADVTYGVAIDANGVVSTRPDPVEVFSGADLLQKLGGFDETIGEFGGDGGNGYAELKNKTFSRLIAVPINIACSQGGRVFRELPTNKSSTDPTPVVPVVGAVVPAGTEFKTGANRVRLAQRVSFSESQQFHSGTDGAVTNAGGTAAFQSFSSAGGGFTTVTRPDGTKGVKVGDILVLGVISGAGALGANANTYRVRAVTSDTQLSLEKLGGALFDWTTGTSQPWRIHEASVADTGTTNHIGTVSGYRVPMRTLDSTIAVDTNLTPTVVPTALTSNTADPLSGLGARSAPTTGLVHVAAVQGPNAVSASALDALYVLAIDALKQDDTPENEVNLIWPARYSAVIDQKVIAHCLEVKATGRGRMSIISPPLDTLSLTTVLGNGAGGAGYQRAEESQFSWPGAQTFMSEAVGKSIKGADGMTYTDGIVDTTGGGWLAAVESQLAPERNPGQASDPVKTVMAQTLGIQRGITGLGINEYKRLKAGGVIAMRNDRRVGRIFQSGVTRSVIPGQQLINRRRFSFFVQDSLADLLMIFTKEPLTESLKDRIVGVHVDFFEGLLSPENPRAARIAGYSLDPKEGNTPEMTDAGIYVVKHTVEMLATADNIVLVSEVGYGFLRVADVQAAA